MTSLFNSKLLIDKSEGKLNEILKFAWNHPERESLDKAFNHLELMCGNRTEHTVVHLYPDFASMSLFFVMVNTKTGNHGLQGGLIYHGSVDGVHKDPMATTLTPTVGWAIHT